MAIRALNYCIMTLQERKLVIGRLPSRQWFFKFVSTWIFIKQPGQFHLSLSIAPPFYFPHAWTIWRPVYSQDEEICALLWSWQFMTTGAKYWLKLVKRTSCQVLRVFHLFEMRNAKALNLLGNVQSSQYNMGWTPMLYRRMKDQDRSSWQGKIITPEITFVHELAEADIWPAPSSIITSCMWAVSFLDTWCRRYLSSENCPPRLSRWNVEWNPPLWSSCLRRNPVVIPW